VVTEASLFLHVDFTAHDYFPFQEDGDSRQQFDETVVSRITEALSNSRPVHIFTGRRCIGDSIALFAKAIHENAELSKTIDVVAVVHDATAEGTAEDNFGSVLTAATWLKATLESIDGDIRFSIARDDVLNRITTTSQCQNQQTPTT